MGSWHELSDELDCWATSNQVATLWWRDDDASALNDPLERLVAVSQALMAPVHLAVIPAKLTREATRLLQNAPTSYVLQHGFAHIDHAPKGEGSWELGAHRPIGEVLAELQLGKEILENSFAEKFFPVVVPPWNRIDQKLIAQLTENGFVAVSVEGERQNQGNTGVRYVNCHCDPIKWKGGARFKGEEKALGAIVSHLKRRREGLCDQTEPTGLCTHHMDHSDELWDFLEQLLQLTNKHAAARWISIDEELTRQ